MAKPRVRLRLIARNEEALLPACLPSARDALVRCLLANAQAQR